MLRKYATSLNDIGVARAEKRRVIPIAQMVSLRCRTVTAITPTTNLNPKCRYIELLTLSIRTRDERVNFCDDKNQLWYECIVIIAVNILKNITDASQLSTLHGGSRAKRTSALPPVSAGPS